MTANFQQSHKVPKSVDKPIGVSLQIHREHLSLTMRDMHLEVVYTIQVRQPILSFL